MNVSVPGDKSISQRALILAALAEGESRITGLLAGADPRSTAEALRALGADIGDLSAGGAVRVRGVGLRGLVQPSAALDLGNSGTGARLLMGVLAGCAFEALLTGDESLQSRPMKRVTEPLSRMGARFEWVASDGRLPLRVRGGALVGTHYDLPVASAQVKSALLLAGVVGGVPVSLTEPVRSRDHTERMLRRVGVPVEDGPEAGRWRVALPEPPKRIASFDYHVPGDFSSAAFLMVAGLLGLAGEGLEIQGVGLNATRTGLLPLLARMGARVEVEVGSDDGTEPVGSLRVEAGEVRGVELREGEAQAAIDEIPALVALAVRARGVTRVVGASELRVKETDRIQALVAGLRAIGVEAEELPDGLVLEGTERPLRGRVDSRLDHRIAMAFGILGALPGCEIQVQGAECVDVSFPSFWETLAGLGGRGGRGSAGAGGAGGSSGGARQTSVERTAPPPVGPVVTLDGPAGSGKSSTAREVARRLGFRHLDSGALYRGLTWALLRSGVPRQAWPDLDEAALARYDVQLRAGTDERFEVLLGSEPLEDRALRAPEVTAQVSTVAGLPAVRAWLLERQREAARQGGLVADGRDMGTVVFPDADVKVFLVADLEERSRRRLREHGVGDPSGEELTGEAARLHDRDSRDERREHAPLRRAEDAWTLDTTGLDFETQVARVVARVRSVLTRAPDVSAP